jgi:hypothetical protein
MYTYNFPEKIVTKVGALQQVLEQSSLKNVLDGIDYAPLVVSMTSELTELQLSDLTTLINNYTDPEFYLTLDHTTSLALHSHFTTDTDNVIIDDKDILQTIIYTASGETSNVVLDGCKSIVEFYCPNPQSFLNTTSGSINIEIYDITRNISIANKTIELNDIAVQWNALANAGSTTGNTVFQSTQFTGLKNKNPDYDCVFQLRGNTSNQDFTFRLNGLQYLYYSVINF